MGALLTSFHQHFADSAKEKWLFTPPSGLLYEGLLLHGTIKIMTTAIMPSYGLELNTPFSN